MNGMLETGLLTDLTMVLREGIAAYPAHGRSIMAISPIQEHDHFDGKGRFNSYDGAGVSFAISQWVMCDQAGTHMDAPWHANRDSTLTVESVPLRYGFGSAIWLDCTAATVESGISVRILEAALAAAQVEIRPHDILLLRTGASDRAISDPVGYATTPVGLTKEAAELLRAAAIKTVGIDCVTIESKDTVATADVHTNFLNPAALGRDRDDVIAIIENLVGLDRIPDHRFVFAGLPLPLEGAAGSPLRAVAIT
jgi:kynurenine formamidase